MKMAVALLLYAGGVGSGCHGPNCGRRTFSYGDLIKQHDFIKDHPFRTALDAVQLDRRYKFQQDQLTSLARNVQTWAKESHDGKLAKAMPGVFNYLKEVEKVGDRGDRGSVLDATYAQESILSYLHDTIRRIHNFEHGLEATAYVQDSKYGDVVSEHSDEDEAKRAASARPYSKVVKNPALGRIRKYPNLNI